MDELRTQLDRQRQVRVVAGEDAPADAVARLQDEDAPPGPGEGVGRRQPGDAGADDQNVGRGDLASRRQDSAPWADVELQCAPV